MNSGVFSTLVLELCGLMLFVFVIMIGICVATMGFWEIIKDIVLWIKKNINKYFRK